MASTIFRIVTLVVIFTVAPTGCGAGFRIVTETEHENEWKVSCIFDGPSSYVRSVWRIRMTRHGQKRPIAFVGRKGDLRIGPNYQNNMNVTGVVTNRKNSYIKLTIEEPGLEDTGTYTCEMRYFKHSHNRNHTKQKLKKSITDLIRPSDEQFKKKFWIMFDKLDKMVKEIHLFDWNQKNRIKVLENQLEEDDEIFMDFVNHYNNRQACRDKGWEYYKEDQTCFKISDEYDKETWESARVLCQKYGGNLIQIHDEKKNTFLFGKAYTTGDEPWIGVNRNATGGSEWQYANGSYLTGYEAWNKELVDQEGKNCVFMQVEAFIFGAWYATYCSELRRYVCSVSARELL